MIIFLNIMENHPYACVYIMKHLVKSNRQIIDLQTSSTKFATQTHRKCTKLLQFGEQTTTLSICYVRSYLLEKAAGLAVTMLGLSLCLTLCDPPEKKLPPWCDRCLDSAGVSGCCKSWLGHDPDLEQDKTAVQDNDKLDNFTPPPKPWCLWSEQIVRSHWLLVSP